MTGDEIAAISNRSGSGSAAYAGGGLQIVAPI